MLEFSLFHKGHSQRMDREMQMLAWHAANLMNCWVPKGKPRITVQKLLPKSGAHLRERGELPPQNMEEAKARARNAQDERDQKDLWDSAGAGRLTEYLGIEPPGGEA